MFIIDKEIFHMVHIQYDRLLEKLNNDSNIKQNIYFMGDHVNDELSEILDKFIADKPTLLCTSGYRECLNLKPINVETLKQQVYTKNDLDKTVVNKVLNTFFNTSTTAKHVLIIVVGRYFNDYLQQFIELFQNTLYKKSLTIFVLTKRYYLQDPAILDNFLHDGWNASILDCCKFIYHERNLPYNIGNIVLNSLLDKCYPSNEGLYPHEILVLNYADKCRVNQQQFYKFWTSYYVYDMKSILNKLEKLAFIKKEQITKKQVKKFTKLQGLSKDKIDFAETLLSSGLISLQTSIDDRKYLLTEKGKKELRDNEYVISYHKKHLNMVETEKDQEAYDLNISDNERARLLSIEENLSNFQQLTPAEKNIIDKCIQFEEQRISIWSLNQRLKGNMRYLDNEIEIYNLKKINDIFSEYKDIVEHYVLNNEPYHNAFAYQMSEILYVMGKFLLTKNSIIDAVQYLFASNVLEISMSFCPYILTSERKICVKSDDLDLEPCYFTNKILNELGKKTITENIQRDIVENIQNYVEDTKNKNFYIKFKFEQIISLIYQYSIPWDVVHKHYDNELIKSQCIPIEYYEKLLKYTYEKDKETILKVYDEILQYYLSLAIDFQYIRDC